MRQSKSITVALREPWLRQPARQTYVGNVSLQAPVTLTTSSSVAVNGRVDGAQRLTVNSAAASFGGAVGGVAPLASLSATVKQALTVSSSIQTSGNISLTVLDSLLTGENIVVGAGASIRSTGGNIAMLSGDNMDVRPQSALSAFGTIELVGDFGNADSGVGSEVLISGSLSAGSVSVAAGADNDTFVFDDNGVSAGGTVRHILAPLTIAGGAGTDLLVLDNSGWAGPAKFALTATTIGAGADDTLFAPGARVSYGGVESLRLTSGSGVDTVDVISTHVGSTQIDTGGSADQVTVRSNSGATSVLTGAGDDTVQVALVLGTVSPLAGPLDISTGAFGNDTLIVDARGNSPGVNVELSQSSIIGLSALPITYAEVDQLQLEFGSGSDLVNIVSTHAGRTSINTSGGADQIRVSSLTGTVAGIHGLLEISAGVDENDVLIVDDSGNSAGVMLQLTSTNLTGFGSASIVYDAVDDLQVKLGSGNDIVLVASTHPGETLIGTGCRRRPDHGHIYRRLHHAAFGRWR